MFTFSGLAILDACHLANSLDENMNNLQQNFQTYDARRYRKLWQLHHISNIAQTFGHVESQSVCNIRDNMMTSSLIPTKWKGYAFDQFIRLVAAVPITMT